MVNELNVELEEPTGHLRIKVRRFTGKRILQQLWKITDASKKTGTYTKVEWRDVPEVIE